MTGSTTPSSVINRRPNDNGYAEHRITSHAETGQSSTAQVDENLCGISDGSVGVTRGCGARADVRNKC